MRRREEYERRGEGITGIAEGEEQTVKGERHGRVRQ